MRFKELDGCAVPRPLYPVLKRLKEESGCTYVSVCRADTPAVRAILAKSGKHTQAYLYAHQGTQGIGPANPPGHSTHELRSDGVAYRVPNGQALKWWQCGMDIDDAHIVAFERAARRHGWSVHRPYASGSEYHHENFVSKPTRWKRLLHNLDERRHRRKMRRKGH